jgi:hypothetical protein
LDSNFPTIGFSDEWQAFFERHPLWPDKFKLLHSTLESVFIRQLSPRGPADRVVFLLGRLCVEDFNEVFLLSGNGYGFGALKILRGLYERAVTSGYIAKHPDQAEIFLEYHHIHQGKMLTHAKPLFEKSRHQISDEEIKNTEKLYKTYKDKFRELLCKKCNTHRTRFSWSPLDLASMSKDVEMQGLYFAGYYFPTLQTHATASAVISRLKMKTDGHISFDPESQRDWSDRALVAAHNVIIHVLSMQNTFFNLQLNDEIDKRSNDFFEIWGRKATEA